MNVGQLKELLEIMPDDMPVYVQTCEADWMAPLDNRNMWVSQAFIDERFKTLEKSKLIITAHVKGQNRHETKNDRSGVLVVYETTPAQQKEE
jgi:hypothetical protein